MLGLFILVLAVTGIVRMARSRGASPVLFGIVAVVGFLIVRGIAAAVLQQRQFPTGGPLLAALIVGNLAPWGWLLAVAWFVRFRIGTATRGPSGSWMCPECRCLNRDYALKCDTCGAPYRAPSIAN
jgi:hypothetical protein